jgi:hypothetical protein
MTDLDDGQDVEIEVKEISDTEEKDEHKELTFGFDRTCKITIGKDIIYCSKYCFKDVSSVLWTAVENDKDPVINIKDYDLNTVNLFLTYVYNMKPMFDKHKRYPDEKLLSIRDVGFILSGLQSLIDMKDKDISKQLIECMKFGSSYDCKEYFEFFETVVSECIKTRDKAKSKDLLELDVAFKLAHAVKSEIILRKCFEIILIENPEKLVDYVQETKTMLHDGSFKSDVIIDIIFSVVARTCKKDIKKTIKNKFLNLF